MRSIRLLFAAVCVMAYALPASAECQKPKADVTIPDGKTATEQELLAARQKVLELDRSIGAYQNCLSGEASQKSVGKDEATRNQIAQAAVDAHNESAAELALLGTCLQSQFDAFRQSGGGKQGTPVDCSTFKDKLQVVDGAPQGGGGDWITEAEGRSVELPTGVWSYSLYRDDDLHACGEKGDKQCYIRMVYVRNGSDQALECNGKIAYAGNDIMGKPSTEHRALVPEKSMRGIVISAAEQTVNATTFDADCTARPQLAALDTPASCKYEVVKPVSIGDYYPEAARNANEEGPVVVEFTLKGAADHPSGVKVVSSSMYPSIDGAAVKAVTDMVLSSSCKNARFRLKLTFKLNE